MKTQQHICCHIKIDEITGSSQCPNIKLGSWQDMVMSIACQIARTRNLYQSLISSQRHCDPLSYVTERGGYVATYVSSPYLAETSYDKHAANVSKLKINYYRYCLAVKDTCGAIWGLLTKIGVGGRQFWEIWCDCYIILFKLRF